ncbi:hypothetical protein F2Q68_00032529 [Brassica cretica]|uniref:A-kinase anchor protein 7-like phosphoesterase domain-containing protein n=1 Tax=Brassica cretica TaxID=69181 RepID=A0A8S9GEP2_BRACR|nr:hypothetical protein F2Q68_00032529 [Brassica cretica]
MKTDLFKNSSKQSSSLQIRGGSSTSHPSPHVSKGKQIVQGHGEVFTHFISLPLAIHPELKQKVETFRNSVLGNNNDRKPLKFQSTLDEMGIEKSMFISPNSLHLTVVMLKLENKEAVDAAQDILKSVSASVRHALDNRPVFIRLKGLAESQAEVYNFTLSYEDLEENVLRLCNFRVVLRLVRGTRKSQPGSLNREKLPLLIPLLSSAKSKTSSFIVYDRSDDNHVKTDLFKDSSKQNLSLGNHGGSSTDHPSPHVSKGKQIVQVYRELYTHFISFPLAIHPELKEKVETFRNSILGDNKDKKPLKFQSTLDERLRSQNGFGMTRTATSIAVVHYLFHISDTEKDHYPLHRFLVKIDYDQWEKLPLLISLLSSARSKTSSFIVYDRSDDNHVKTDLFKDSSKQNLSLGNHGGSSTDHPSPHVSKGKQIVQVYRELYTHFISFPLAIHPELKEKVETFRNSILGDNKDKKPLKFQSTLDEMGIENRMFISPNCLHLTVVMLRLVNKEAVDAAQDILKVDFIVYDRSDDNHVKTDLFKDSSKQNLSLGNHGGSSTDHPSPHVSKGKQIVQVYRELYTHFISFPLAIHPELKEKVETFRNSILGDNKDKKPLKFQSTLDEMGIENRMFISPNCLHLTVVMLRLVNKEAVDAAQDILKVESISASVMYALDNRPVFIRLKGLSSMNGSLEKTRVLYAPVEEVGDEDRLLRACRILLSPNLILFTHVPLV